MMAIEFNADEVFEMAEQIERNGSKFYRKASEGASEPSTRQLLNRLADWELEHEKKFAAMRASLSDKEREQTVYDPDNQAALYLRAMADGHVFDVKSDPSKRLTGKDKIEDVLRMAIGLEKDSIVFYVAMRAVVPPRLGKESLEGIIGDEMSHVTLLSNELRALRR